MIAGVVVQRTGIATKCKLVPSRQECKVRELVRVERLFQRGGAPNVESSQLYSAGERVGPGSVSHPPVFVVFAAQHSGPLHQLSEKGKRKKKENPRKRKGCCTPNTSQ
jgi:hypothetical protein